MAFQAGTAVFSGNPPDGGKKNLDDGPKGIDLFRPEVQRVAPKSPGGCANRPGGGFDRKRESRILPSVCGKAGS